GKVVQLRLQKMQLGEPDASGRRSPVAIEGDEELLEVDTVVAALGQGISPDGFDGISLTRGNTIIADEHMFTTNEKGVFAIGDCINDGAAIAIKAIGDAKRAAASVDGYLRGEDARYKAPYRVIRSDMTQDDFADIKKEPRARVSHLSPDERFDSFFEVTKRLDKNMAVREAARCLECGCHDYFECKLIALADQYDVHPERYRESVLKVAVEDNHPFIIRDPNKCILCGLCVRICSEVVGSTALGFVDRGFDTVVKPAFEDPLGETSCVSCGQCVSVCPTGALQERIPFIKPVPLDTKKTDSICGLCAVGCSTRVESHGNRLVKTTPARDRGINNGVMCGRGRFGLSYVYKDGRIITPMIRKKGVLEPASWNDALVHIAKKMESLAMRGEKTAVSIGQNYCVEDAGAVMNLAKLFNAEMFSFANRDNGLAMVLGSDASPNTLEEVLATGGIFVFGSSPMHNPVILARLREAARYGVPVTVVSADDDEFNISCDVIKVPNTTGFIKQVIKSLIDSGCKPKRAVGFDELRDSLAGITVGDGARTFAERYIAAKKAMVLFALGELSVAAAVEIANMAVVAGHIGSPRNGIYMLRQMSGSQTLADLGITATADALAGTKGLLVFGEDTDIRSDELEFLAVQDTHITDTAKHADVVLPLAVYPEIDGTYVNTERRIQHCRGVIKPPMAYRTSEIAQRIAEVVDASALAGDVRALYPSTRIGECSPTPVMHADGFGFDDNMARLTVAAESAFVEELAQTSYLMNAVTADMP
ncbi:MAG: molybdopterin-dependent oxidoreductase, partial [Oscillospiraceae bacterium]|nr:molybdopterin-dependent oxidoreductase [Oscillospiraceae bacterium]